jgi:hypothetical protein
LTVYTTRSIVDRQGSVGQTAYRRTIAIDGRHGSIAVTAAGAHALELQVSFPDPRALHFVLVVGSGTTYTKTSLARPNR